jgi:hypothetical protein
LKQLNINQINQHLNNNKRLYLDDNKNWKVAGFKQRLARVFLPGYAKRRDAECAEAIFQKLHHLLEQVPSTDKDATTTASSAEELKQTAAAADTYLKKVLDRHWFKPKHIKRVMAKLKQEISIYKLGSKLDLPFNTLLKNPDFVKFALKNHLQYKITPGHKESGFGVTIDKKGMFFLHKRGENNEPIAVPWTEIPKKESGAIKGLELFAYGWQPYDSKTNIQLDPVKIYDAEGEAAKKPRIELKTIRPSYSIKNIGLGTFGHSFIRLHEPILDEKNNPTGKVKVYSIGYDLSSIVFRDPFEDINRSACSTFHELSHDDLEKSKKLITELRKLEIEKKNNRHHRSSDPKIEHIYKRAVEKTCANFSSKIYEEFTGVRFNGRPLITRILFPTFLEPIFDTIWNILPSALNGVKKKIQIVTRGAFPQMMVFEHRKHPEYSPKIEHRRTV